MKNFKTFTALLLTAVLAFAFSACSSSIKSGTYTAQSVKVTYGEKDFEFDLTKVDFEDDDFDFFEGKEDAFANMNEFEKNIAKMGISVAIAMLGMIEFEISDTEIKAMPPDFSGEGVDVEDVSVYKYKLDGDKIIFLDGDGEEISFTDSEGDESSYEWAFTYKGGKLSIVLNSDQLSAEAVYARK